MGGQSFGARDVVELVAAVGGADLAQTAAGPAPTDRGLGLSHPSEDPLFPAASQKFVSVAEPWLVSTSNRRNKRLRLEFSA